MNIRTLITHLRKMFAKLESGQALAEYMPTIAGAMVLTTVALVAVGGGVKESYCKVTDAFGDRPATCEDSDTPGDTAEVPDEDGETPGDEDTPGDAVCVVSITSADGSDPETWGEWDGNPDELLIEVQELPGPVTWSLTMWFPNDPESEETVIGSGELTSGEVETVAVNYPAKGDWGPVSGDGDGRYEAQVALEITEPCGSVDWERWYKADVAADLGIDITHDVPTLTADGETLVYTMVVTNYGPNNAEVVDDQGVVVSLPVPGDANVVSVTPSQGECDTEIACDLGALAFGASATIDVETTVGSVASCDLFAESTVSSAAPVDPDLSNNVDDTDPLCESAVVCDQSVSDIVLVDAVTDTEIGPLTNGMEIVLQDGDEINVVAKVAGDVGSVVFELNGKKFATENFAPYAMAGDSAGDYNKWSVAAGSYALTVKPYGEPDGQGENCAARTVNFTIVKEGVEDEEGGIWDPEQPYGEPYAECPESHPTQIAEYDYYATPENLSRALQWGVASRQSHTHTFSLAGDWDTVLLMRGAVGHPEMGCPEDPHHLCSRPNQGNEHWAVDIDGARVAFNPDNYYLDHVYMIYPNAHLGVLPAGSHEIRIYHAGLLDEPIDTNKPSVGAWVSVCVSTTD